MVSDAEIRKGTRGFSLLELLIVVGIIALLLVLLMPAVSAARKVSRSASCLANLQQWGQSYQMYRNNNRGVSVALKIVNPPNPSLRWWELLSPYMGDVRKAMLCPEATQRPPVDPIDPSESVGSASMAWWGQRGDWLGSYGVNKWISARPVGGDARGFIRFPPRNGDSVPLMGDCCLAWESPSSDNVVPANLNNPEHSGMGPFCIDRHRMAINVVFLDGHAEHVPLARLWKLRWSETFVPKDVVVPRP